MTRFPDVNVYLQTDREERDSEFVHIAKVPMTSTPIRGDIINVRDYYFEGVIDNMPARIKSEFLQNPFLFVERVTTHFHAPTKLDPQAEERTDLIVTFKKMPEFFR